MAARGSGKNKGGEKGKSGRPRKGNFVQGKQTPPKEYTLLEPEKVDTGLYKLDCLPVEARRAALASIGGVAPPRIDQETQEEYLANNKIVTRSGVTYNKDRNGKVVKIGQKPKDFAWYLVIGARQSVNTKRLNDKSQLFFAKKIDTMDVVKGKPTNVVLDDSDHTRYHIMKIGCYNGSDFFNIHSNTVVRAKIHKRTAHHTVLTSVMGVNSSWIPDPHDGANLDLYDEEFVRSVCGGDLPVDGGDYHGSSIHGYVANLIGASGTFHILAPDIFCRIECKTNNLLDHDEGLAPGSLVQLCYSIQGGSLKAMILPRGKGGRPAYAVTVYDEGSVDGEEEVGDFSVGKD